MKTYYLLSNEITVTIEGNIILDKNTEFQHAEVIDTKDNRYLLLDSIVQFSKNDEYIYHESIAHPAMLASKNPKKILVIGGGDGGTLREILKYNVEKVILCELDKEVIEISKKFFPEVSSGAFDDPRVEIVHMDGRKFVEDSKEEFDVIINDLTDPSGPSKLLFTKEFYQIVKDSLKKDGILSLDGDVIGYNGLFLNVVKTVESVFEYTYPYLVTIPSFFLKEGFIVCSKNDISFMKNEKRIEKFIEKNKFELKYFNPNDLSNLFTKTKFIEEALKKDYRISTDKKPLEVDSYQLSKKIRRK